MTATPPDDTHPHDDPVISPDRDHRGMLIAIMLEWLIAIVGIRSMIYIGIQETIAGKHGVLIWGYISVLAMGAAGCLILVPMICVSGIRRWSTPLAVIDAAGIESPKDRPAFIAWNDIEKFRTWTSRGITRLTIQGKTKQQIHFWIGNEGHPLVNAVRAGYEAAQHSK